LKFFDKLFQLEKIKEIDLGIKIDKYYSNNDVKEIEAKRYHTRFHTGLDHHLS